MPGYSPARKNPGFYAAQHYRKTAASWGESERTLETYLRPTKNHYVVGSCGGLVLSWIKRVHITDNVKASPDSAESTVLQYMTYFPSGSRQTAYDREDFPEEEELRQLYDEALVSAPTSAKRRRSFLKVYRATGFHSVYRGLATPNEIVRTLRAHGEPDHIKTYLLTAQRHGTALAISKDQVVFYDPNKGPLVMNRGDALGARKILYSNLHNWVSRGSSNKIAITELSYFDGINRKHFRFDSTPHAYKRLRPEMRYVGGPDLGFLADLWGTSGGDETED